MNTQTQFGTNRSTTEESQASDVSVYNLLKGEIVQEDFVDNKEDSTPLAYIMNRDFEYYLQGSVSKLPPEFQFECFNDTANASFFLRLFGDQVCYVKGLGWLTWDGNRWLKDSEHLVMQLAKDAGRLIRNEALALSKFMNVTKFMNHANKSSNAHSLKSMLKLSAPEVTLTINDFDQEKFIINCQNGILNLETGVLLKHTPQVRVTKMTGVIFNPNAKCPNFLKFLDRIMPDNKLQNYLQRATGYSLTAETNEQVFFFLHGSGANGKSTFLRVLLEIFGDYGDQASINFLSEPGRFEIAGLAGLRFCSTIEVTEGKPFAEEFVKQMTGNDRLTGEYKFKDKFSFEPTHKIWLAANHRPLIKGTDNAIWRRVKVIPFSETIPEEEQDKKLLDLLLSELPGIFNWAVQGCLDWQEYGLNEPVTVKLATTSYREDSDLIAQFLQTCCYENEDHEEGATDLYKSFLNWCETCGEHPLSQSQFGIKLEEKGFTRKHTHDGNIYLGISLKQ